METLKRILIKTCSKPMQRIYTMVPADASVISSMHSLCTTPLITMPRFPLLNCKRILQVEFLNDTLVHMQLEVLNIGTFKMFKTKF